MLFINIIKLASSFVLALEMNHNEQCATLQGLLKEQYQYPECSRPIVPNSKPMSGELLEIMKTLMNCNPLDDGFTFHRFLTWLYNTKQSFLHVMCALVEYFHTQKLNTQQKTLCQKTVWHCLFYMLWDTKHNWMYCKMFPAVDEMDRVGLRVFFPKHTGFLGHVCYTNPEVAYDVMDVLTHVRTLTKPFHKDIDELPQDLKEFNLPRFTNLTPEEATEKCTTEMFNRLVCCVNRLLSLQSL